MAKMKFVTCFNLMVIYSMVVIVTAAPVKGNNGLIIVIIMITGSVANQWFPDWWPFH